MYHGKSKVWPPQCHPLRFPGNVGKKWTSLGWPPRFGAFWELPEVFARELPRSLEISELKTKITQQLSELRLRFNKKRFKLCISWFYPNVFFFGERFFDVFFRFWLISFFWFLAGFWNRMPIICWHQFIAHLDRTFLVLTVLAWLEWLVVCRLRETVGGLPKNSGWSSFFRTIGDF